MRPATIEDLQTAVRQITRALPRGGGSKPALSTPPDGVVPIDMSAISGMIEYDPGEFTFTALAGTRIADVTKRLEAHHQYLPFDPPLVERGATLGGTVAAGVSGPGRYRYGGVRDFLIGVRYVDGAGELVCGGGRVVKNAAGFDFPKLMVGSLGQLGVLVELSFKVFPKPEAYASLRLDCANLTDALQGLYRLYASQLDIDSLDIEATPDGATLWVRLAGLRTVLPARLNRLRDLLGGGEMLDGPDEATSWRTVREMEWAPAGWSLIKVPLTPRCIPALEESLKASAALRRYSAGGQVAWLATPDPLQAIDEVLAAQELSGLVLFGPAGRPRLGLRIGDSFARRVKEALDPVKRFVEG